MGKKGDVDDDDDANQASRPKEFGSKSGSPESRSENPAENASQQTVR